MHNCLMHNWQFCSNTPTTPYLTGGNIKFALQGAKGGGDYADSFPN